jgi:AcrR family transcriptional regulator
LSTAEAPSRRDRLRAATLDEIKQTARRLLVTDGATAVTLRAIAREMGMTAPALYRYFPSYEDLIKALCASLYHELTDELEQARDAVHIDDVVGRMYAVCRSFRRWSVGHPAEFGLMFGSPQPALNHSVEDPHDPLKEPHVAADRFARVFAYLFAEMWGRKQFPVPDRDELSPSLCAQLDGYLDQLGATGLPVGAAQTFLSCWIRLYGLVALEVFGHLHFALTDPEPMFEQELSAVAQRIGGEPRPLAP